MRKEIFQKSKHIDISNNLNVKTKTHSNSRVAMCVCKINPGLRNLGKTKYSEAFYHHFNTLNLGKLNPQLPKDPKKAPLGKLS